MGRFPENVGNWEPLYIHTATGYDIPLTVLRLLVFASVDSPYRPETDDLRKLYSGFLAMSHTFP